MASYNSVKAIPAPAYLIQFTDGRGQTEIKVAFLLGDEIRFLNEDSLSRPAQEWLKNDILVSLGMREATKETEPQVASTPTEADLESQI
jgi:hypothetical protein